MADKLNMAAKSNMATKILITKMVANVTSKWPSNKKWLPVFIYLSCFKFLSYRRQLHFKNSMTKIQNGCQVTKWLPNNVQS